MTPVVLEEAAGICRMSLSVRGVTLVCDIVC